MVQPLWKTVRWFLKKLSIELPNGPAIPFLDIHLIKFKNMDSDPYVPVTTAVRVTKAKQ